MRNKRGLSRDACFRQAYSTNHPVCVSCQQSGVVCGKKARRVKKVKGQRIHHSGPEHRGGLKVMVCHTDLRTPNDWNNKIDSRLIYLGERSKWTRLFRNVLHLWGPQPQGVRRRLSVTRIVPNRRFLMKDLDNRFFSLKPLEDALKINGVLIDDAEEFLETLPPRQEIDPQRQETVVEVVLEDLVDEF